MTLINSEGVSARSRPVGPSGSPLVGRGDADRTAAVTRSLLGYGVLVGPIYVVVGLAQGLTRDGFDLSRHDLSLLANGPWGWVQITNLILCGTMTLAAALGMNRSLLVLGGRGAAWGPRLVAGYGLGLIGSGIFVADPMNGFPVGTPDGAPVNPSVGGVGHILFGAIGFMCLIAACWVFASRFAAERRSGLVRLSRGTGVLFLAAFAGLATGADDAATVLGFWAAVILAWVWLATCSIDLYRRTPLLTPAAVEQEESS